jgi:ubiquinone/menaquinone biosynthesis C-methylase UbiE
MLEATWRSDFFGTLNDLPPEPVAELAHTLEIMGSEPGYRAVRLALLRELAVPSNGTVVDAGCGTGVALTDLQEVYGTGVHVIGVDPTENFLEFARKRAGRLGAAARYEAGDIRELRLDDASVDAAFCDKVLLHTGPTAAALAQLVRVVRPGGRVGAIEWYPQFMLSTTDRRAEEAFNAMIRQTCYDYTVAGNLARHFRAAGLRDLSIMTSVVGAETLDEHPFWRAFLIEQLPLFVHAGVLTDEVARNLAEDLEALNSRGAFSAAFMVRTAVGVRPA